ncbi:DnaA ATPase domain-containing protein [Neorickettsia sp. 179522]|uniref:DnaA ATPase domain-containing protein n=1 Tax=Neorickettsia sp. 179522 TaxID=1714371 RepID=UPI000796E98D|nr:DnaA/Hda family protein [Neorickettsia sp. 179522]KYH12326.1 hypothetical protein AS219_00685 [Neorickettsia sp. 179522]
MKQLILIDNQVRENTYSAADYFVSESNLYIYKSLVETPSNKKPIVLKGHSKSGKTHIGRVWASKHGADILSNLPDQAHLAIHNHCFIDDIDKLTTQEEIEALLHIYNSAVENGKILLMTTRSLDFSDVLPDLSSRLRSSITYSIPPPDDELLRVVTRKQFYLYQTRVSENVVNLVLQRVDRSLEAVVDFVALLNREALHKGKPISARLFRETSASASKERQSQQ